VPEARGLDAGAAGSYHAGGRRVRPRRRGATRLAAGLPPPLQKSLLQTRS